MRVVWLCLVSALLSLLPALAWAQENVKVTFQAMVYQNGTPQTDTTAAQIAARPDADFSPFNPQTTYVTGPQKHIWLRLRFTSAQAVPAHAWLVDFSKPFVDTVVMHTRGADGAWTFQAAGDWLAHSSWPVRSLTPQFFVPARNAGSQDVFLEVRNRIPIHFDLRLLSAQQARIAAQNNFFLIGLATGLMMLMATVSIVLAITYRQTVYAWYGIYVAINIVLSAAYAGLAGYALWPDATQWPEISISLLYMLGMVVQLQFCRRMFLALLHPTWLKRCVVGTMVLGLLAIPLHFYVHSRFGNPVIFSVQIFALAGASLSLMVYQFQRGYLVSWLCLVSCAPLMVVGCLSVVENVGWAALPWLPYNAPIYAFAFEMPLLFSALYLHAKTQHAKLVRKYTLAGTDPLTGFVSSSLHQTTLTDLWNGAQAAKRDIAVAYVQVRQELGFSALRWVPVSQRVVQRAVRLLRTVAGEQDTVAHVRKDVFALIMPNAAMGDDLSGKLSRLIALATMTDKDAVHETPFRFRIVASTLGQSGGTAVQIDAALQDILSKPVGWHRRTIRFLSKKPLPKQSSKKEEETLSEFWRRASEKESTL